MTSPPPPPEEGPAAFVVPAPELFDRAAWPRPPFALLMALMAGMVLGHGLAAPLWVGLAGIAIVLAFHGILLLRHAGRSDRLPPPRAEWLLLAVVFLGMWTSGARRERERHAQEVAQWAASHWLVTVEGRLAEAPRRFSTRTRLVVAPGATIRGASSPVAVESPVALKIEVDDSTGTDERAWRERWRTHAQGDRVRAIGSFRPAGAGYRNPGAASLPLTLRGGMVLGPLQVHSTGDVVVSAPDGGRSAWNRFLGVVVLWRDAARDRLRQSAGPEAGPLLLAVVLGDTSEVSPGQHRVFGRAGLLHLFSVSGLHAGIIALALYGLLSGLRLPRRWQMATILAGVFAYAALTGFRIPVVRTFIMVGALGMQAWLRRPTDSLSRLSLAAIVILLMWPGSLFEAGFQLSFLAVFTLIVFGPWIAESVAFSVGDRTGWKALAIRQGQWTTRALVTFAILQLALLPVLANDFRQVSLIAPVANLFVIPVATVSLLAGAAIAGPGAALPGLAAVLGPVAAGAANLAMALSEAFAWIPFASLPVEPLPPTGAVLYLGCLFGGGYLVFGRGPGHGARRRASAWIHAAGIVAVVVWLPWLQPQPASKLRVTFLDVGQGDCALIELPDGHGTVLIDAGPSQPAEVARRAIAPALRFRGIDAIDLAVATHADADHIGGFSDLMRELPIRRMAAAPGVQGGPTWDQVQRDFALRHGRRLEVDLGDRIRTALPDLRLEILHPAEEDLAQGTDRNTDSVVLRLQWKSFALLLTGDADTEAEERMIRRWGKEALRSTVLKAGHHGSDSSTSDAFLDAVRPAFAVFSCGRHNRYGHPSPNVLDRCRARRIQTHRTDLQGALVIETDGKQMWATAWGER